MVGLIILLGDKFLFNNLQNVVVLKLNYLLIKVIELIITKATKYWDFFIYQALAFISDLHFISISNYMSYAFLFKYIIIGDSGMLFSLLRGG